MNSHSQESRPEYGNARPAETFKTQERAEGTSVSEMLRRHLASAMVTAGTRMRALARDAGLFRNLTAEAQEMFNRSLRGADRYMRIAVLGIVLTGALSQQADRPLREIRQDQEIARTVNHAGTVETKRAGTEMRKMHSDSLTTASLDYLAGRGPMPSYLEEELLREELARRYYQNPDERRLLPVDLEGSDLERLESAYAEVLRGDGNNSMSDSERTEVIQEYTAPRDYDYDVIVEQKLWELEEYAGSPQMRLCINTPYLEAFKAGVEPTEEYLKNFHFKRSRYNPQSNTIFVDHVDILQMRKDAIAEYAHAFERQDNPVRAVRNVQEDHRVAKAVAVREGIPEHVAYDKLMYEQSMHSGPLHEWHAHQVTEQRLKQQFRAIIERTAERHNQ